MGSILYPYNDELYHHGILNQKWGLRRFQNRDGSLTAAGRLRYAKNTEGKDARIAAAKEKKAAEKQARQEEKAAEKQARKEEKAAKQQAAQEKKAAEEKARQEKKAAKEKAQLEKTTTPRQRAKQMPYDELKQEVSRLNLEKQYENLYKELNPQKKSLAKKLVDGAINTSYKSITNAANRELSSIMDEITTSAIRKVKDELKKQMAASKGS